MMGIMTLDWNKYFAKNVFINVLLAVLIIYVLAVLQIVIEIPVIVVTV